MALLLNALFWLNLSLLLVHEMDAIRRHEWRLFVFLRGLEDEKAHQIFTAVHIPLFLLLFWFVTASSSRTVFFFQIFIDLFLVVHKGLHFLFRNHPKNEFTNRFSKAIIDGMAVLGLIHLIILVSLQAT